MISLDMQDVHLIEMSDQSKPPMSSAYYVINFGFLFYMITTM
jgi:hypothetical protein